MSGDPKNPFTALLEALAGEGSSEGHGGDPAIASARPAPKFLKFGSGIRVTHGVTPQRPAAKPCVCPSRVLPVRKRSR